MLLACHKALHAVVTEWLHHSDKQIGKVCRQISLSRGQLSKAARQDVCKDPARYDLASLTPQADYFESGP